ncbi:peptidoglycan DD-metalloendopeptidase family protein [Streptomyces sp. MUM 136J]|uniref:M23 family metallopeptidase n=1 Tax=Streptomyces sp. MUM 136J TaxID=2791992 RepID=UPI001F041D68|nr:LysM peptidoglycan-binding domain-containing M23 family metallopeptidase [Streptomyces sp. MUM 136J]MCH0572386.1 peptidoglycan DD-metalloendopeptidase family protein [Streptomyces sp. MUM 136J]
MPAKGKHRRPKALRFTRSIAVASTGGAALALPLLGATGAHAATPQSAPGKAVSQVVQKKATVKSAAVRHYTVKAGDYLSKIAHDQHVNGGWKKLYADNRAAIGSDPSLIHPGLKLVLGKKAATGKSSAPSAAKPSTKTSAAKSSAAKPAAKTVTAAKPAVATGYSLPVAGASVGTGYHVAGSMWSSGYHTGVDFVVPTGTSLKAVASGTVVSAGWGGAYGNQVVIKLHDGYYAQYAHLSQLSVSAGQTVGAGQQIGLSGATGNVTGPHLHFEIRTTPNYGSDVDPVAYLRSHGLAVG